MTETVFTYGNLLRAARKCMRGVGWKNSVIKWRENLPAYCLRLERELARGTFKWSAPVQMAIASPKPRMVNSLRFRDRVVQRCMCDNGLYDDLTRGNDYDNGACQNGKGTAFSRGRLIRHLRRHWLKHGDKGWVLSLDVSRFFDSIPHGKLVNLVFQRVKSNRHRWMVRDLIRMGGKDGVGLDLGSPISQLLAVAYLTPVDYLCRHVAGVAGYVRYCDDIIALVPPVCVQPDGREVDGLTVARNLRDKVAAALGELGLALNPRSTIHPIRQGVRFLGHRHTIKGGGRVVAKPLRDKLRRQRGRLRRMLAKGVPPDRIARHLAATHQHTTKEQR